MRFTDEPALCYTAFPMGTLQIFSVKVAGIKRCLQWPLDVFGFVAVRDNIDRNRNIIFNRTRSSCQTLTEKVLVFLIYHSSLYLYSTVLPNAVYLNFPQTFRCTYVCFLIALTMQACVELINMASLCL